MLVGCFAEKQKPCLPGYEYGFAFGYCAGGGADLAYRNINTFTSTQNFEGLTHG
jgi:hypothetical protein